MRVALIISGYLRTFKLNYPNLKEKILDQFENVDIYLHITENEEKDDRYLNQIEDISNIKKELNPICIIVEPNIKFFDDKNKNNIFNSFSKLYKLNQIKIENEKYIGQYDIVIKYRPDLNIISDYIFEKPENNILIPSDSKIDKGKLKNPNDSYLCDIFAYGSSKMMDKYFEVFNHLPKLSDKYGDVSETLIYHYLNDNHITYKTIDIEYTVILSMCNVFAICGDSGSGKSTLGEILKRYFSNSFMLECDRYHKWERKDENWNKYTHLNTDANYITKMNEDIFNLKVGNSIYQVDYNHVSGKFTEPEKIETSDNMIVCGLHSLYTENQNLYNLKIFIDTHDTLKYTWKIKRDMQKRGYSKEQILNQIESRKNDYINYILPQRDKSDIIINFFTDDDFDINRLDEIPNIKLRIIIKKRFNLFPILKSFTSNSISYDFVVEDNYYIIVIDKFSDHNLNLNYSSNNFYDYILYIILNIKDQQGY